MSGRERARSGRGRGSGPGRLGLVVLAAWLSAWPAGAGALELGPRETALDGVWLFRAGDNPAFAQPALDDRDWDERLVPTGATPWRLRWHGYGWYRLHLGVGERALGADLLLSLGPARAAIEVYVNGSLVASRGRFGSRPQGGAGAAPLLAMVPAALLRGGDNVVAVRAYDPTWSGALPAGPILIGPPDVVGRRAGSDAGLAAVLALAAAALSAGLGHAYLLRRRRAGREGWWLGLAGAGLAAALAAPTGLLDALGLPVELGARLPLLGAAAGTLGVTAFLAARHDDLRAPHVRAGAIGFAALLAALLLAPGAAVFYAGWPAVWLTTLVATLYAARLLAGAARRQEPYGIALFAALVAFALLLLRDGVHVIAVGAALPPPSLVAGVGLLTVAAFTSVRAILEELERQDARAHGLEERLVTDRQVGVLEATSMSVQDRPAFLEAVVREAARDLAVRRCSLMLARGGGLAMAAAMGHPRRAEGAPPSADGAVAGWVFAHRRPASDRRWPAELGPPPRSAQYATASFISHPVTNGDGRCLGVLNASDRLDGAPLGEADERAVGEVARRLALVLERLGGA